MVRFAQVDGHAAGGERRPSCHELLAVDARARRRCAALGLRETDLEDLPRGWSALASRLIPGAWPRVGTIDAAPVLGIATCSGFGKDTALDLLIARGLAEGSSPGSPFPPYGRQTSAKTSAKT